MGALTINDLYKALAECKKKGMGNKKILLSGDDEGNSFHKLFYLVTEITDDFAYANLSVPIEKAKEEYVIIG